MPCRASHSIIHRFEDSPGPRLIDGERDRPLTTKGEVKLSTFSGPAPDPVAPAVPGYKGKTITDLQDLVERHDLSAFVRIALAEYLRANHLPSITYYELSLGEQGKIQARARELELRRNTVTTTTKTDQTPKVVEELRSARTAWLESHGVPISFEFVRFAEAVGKAEDSISEMLAALEGVLRVADRKTREFDAARAAIQKARGIAVPVSSGHEGAVE